MVPASVIQSVGKSHGASAVRPEDYLDIVIVGTQEQAMWLYQNYTSLRTNRTDNEHMNRSAWGGEYYAAYEFSGSYAVLATSLEFRYDCCDNKKNRMAHNVSYHAVFVPLTCLANMVNAGFWLNMLVDLNVIVANQLIRIFKNQTGHLMQGNSMSWSWGPEHYSRYFGEYSTSSILLLIWRKCAVIVRAVLTFALVSVVCSVATRVIVLSGLVVMIVIG